MTEDGTAGESGAPTCSCKLGRVTQARGLATVDARLRERRAGGASLRDLERFVNRALLERALEDASTDAVGDVDGVYDALVGEDASAGERTEVRARLSRAGVDVEALLGEFVSYQTVRSHLRDCLGVDTGREEPLDPEDATGTIEWARARSEGIVSRTLERLARDDRIAAGDLDVSHVIRVSCTSCGATATVGAFLDQGGCDCDRAGEDGDRTGEDGDR